MRSIYIAEPADIGCVIANFNNYSLLLGIDYSNRVQWILFKYIITIVPISFIDNLSVLC